MQDSTGPHFILSGARSGTSPSGQGTYGHYWSSLAHTSATHAYLLLLKGTDSTVYPANGNYKRYGFTLRCLGKKGITTLKSFRLPTGGPSGEYQTLYNNYNSYDDMTDTAGPHFVLGGHRNGTSPYEQGTNGNYWSSSAYTVTTYAYRLDLNGTNSTVNPAIYNNKRHGRTLRCLGNTAGEFQSLYNQYPTYDQMRKYPVGMVLGGFYSWDTGTLGTQGTNCYYWSGSAYTGSTDSYRLNLNGTSSAVFPADYGLKRRGLPLRCLAQKGITTLKSPTPPNR